MTLQTVQSNYDSAEEAAKKSYIKDFCRWLKEFYPAAEEFEFDGCWESDDEGGSDLHFSSFYVNGEDFGTILAENKEMAEQFFAAHKGRTFWGGGTFEEKVVDEDWISEYLSDEMCDIPEFMYDRKMIIADELKL